MIEHDKLIYLGKDIKNKKHKLKDKLKFITHIK